MAVQLYDRLQLYERTVNKFSVNSRIKIKIN